MDRFGEKLRALRVGRGLTQKQLALRLGFQTHSHIAEMEAGKRVPTAPVVLRVARVFGVTTDSLLMDELDVDVDG